MSAKTKRNWGVDLVALHYAAAAGIGLIVNRGIPAEWSQNPPEVQAFRAALELAIAVGLLLRFPPARPITRFFTLLGTFAGVWLGLTLFLQDLPFFVYHLPVAGTHVVVTAGRVQALLWFFTAVSAVSFFYLGSQSARRAFGQTTDGHDDAQPLASERREVGPRPL